MRSLRILLVAALALVALASPAAAQFQYYPGGGIVVSTDQVNASGQVATAQSLIPSSIITTQTSFCYTNHCQLDVQGYLSSSGGSTGTLTIAYSYGGISLSFSARTVEAALNNVPFRTTCIVAPNSTVASGTSGNITGKAIDCEWTYVPSNTQGTTPFTARARTTGTITNTATQTQALTATFTNTGKGDGIIATRQWFGAGS